MTTIFRFPFFPVRRLAALLLLCLMSACNRPAESVSALGNASVGAIRLQVYQELEPRAAVSGEMRFGEQVELLRRRRNFYYVRNKAGVEGWTHRSGLFNDRQANEVNALARLAADSPSQGDARVYSLLNAHNHPNRNAPSIFQIKEGDLVKVILHERHPRAPYETGPLLDSSGARAAAQPTPEDPDPSDEIRPPAPPPAPQPPRAWMQLSGLKEARIQQLAAAGVTDEYQPPNREAFGDLWTLVLNADGLAGWVLNARLAPAIPDRVAQYAEGARITSYFALSEALREGAGRSWLWTTLSVSDVAYDFDSFRIFTWNSRAGRYETAFIQRGVEGYLPAEVSRTETSLVRFRLSLRERSGLIHRKTYELSGLRVRLVQNIPWPNYDPLKQLPVMQRLPEPAFEGRPAPIQQPTFWDRLVDSPARAWQRLRGA